MLISKSTHIMRRWGKTFGKIPLTQTANPPNSPTIAQPPFRGWGHASSSISQPCKLSNSCPTPFRGWGHPSSSISQSTKLSNYCPAPFRGWGHASSSIGQPFKLSNSCSTPFRGWGLPYPPLWNGGLSLPHSANH